MYKPIPDSIKEKHIVHVSPHLIVFDRTTRSATLEFKNTSAVPKEAAVLVQLGYGYYPNTDTTLFPPHWQWTDQFPHDTVVANPQPGDHYAGAWLSGVPTHLALKPHQTLRVTLRIDPPAHLPDGEYYARIITVIPPRFTRGGAHDTRKLYQLPLSGHGPPPLRDSVRIFYRQGRQSMGVQLSLGKAQIDTSDAGYPAGFLNPLRDLVRVHLTGSAHFEGYLRWLWKRDDGTDAGEWIAGPGNTFVFYRDGIMRTLAQAEHLRPGHYTETVMFIPLQSAFPPAQRIPAQPAQISFPFYIPPP